MVHRKRRWAPFRERRTPRSCECAARDSNPEQLRWDIDDFLSVGEQPQCDVPADAATALDRPDPVRPPFRYSSSDRKPRAGPCHRRRRRRHRAGLPGDQGHPGRRTPSRGRGRLACAWPVTRPARVARLRRRSGVRRAVRGAGRPGRRDHARGAAGRGGDVRPGRHHRPPRPRPSRCGDRGGVRSRGRDPGTRDAPTAARGHAAVGEGTLERDPGKGRSGRPGPAGRLSPARRAGRRDRAHRRHLIGGDADRAGSQGSIEASGT